MWCDVVDYCVGCVGVCVELSDEVVVVGLVV